MLPAFTQRVAVDFHIQPFEAAVVQDYIQHRLAVSGRDTPLFTVDACAKIASATKGIPRRINILCNTALVYGYSSESAIIDVDVIEEVLSDKAEFGALSSLE